MVLRNRWAAIGLVAVGLLAVNVIGRLIVLLFGMPPNQQLLTSLYSMLAMALLAGWAGFRWARRYDAARIVGEVGLAVVTGSLLTVLVGPLVVGMSPFSGGSSLFLRLLGICFAITALGAAIGALLVLALGQDRTGRAWQRAADRSRDKPHRTVRR